MCLNTLHAKKLRGFTLIELLVGMAIGVIVASSAIALFMVIARSASTMVQTNRMQQELRQTSMVMLRDIARAGFSGVVPGLDFDGDDLPDNTQSPAEQLNSIRQDILFNPWLQDKADIRVGDNIGSNDCILFTYNVDKDLPPAGDEAEVEDDEWFGYRREEDDNGRGIIQMKTAGRNEDRCNHGDWEAISSDEVDVTGLAFSMVTDEIEIDNLSGGTAGVCEEDDSCQCIRTVSVTIAVALNMNNDVSSTLTDSVRVRNDKITDDRSNKTHCHD